MLLSAQPDEVGAGVVKPEIIDKGSDLDMILSPNRGRQTQAANQNEKCNTPHWSVSPFEFHFDNLPHPDEA